MTHLQPAPENDWHPKAACRGHDPDLWFGWEGESINAREARDQAAKRICATCPVRTQCPTHALPYPEAYGTWAGAPDTSSSLTAAAAAATPHPPAPPPRPHLPRGLRHLGGLNEHELVAERCRRGLKPAPRSDYHRLITCAGCNNTKPHNGRGPDGQPLCAACRFRWVQAGRPATVP